MRVKFLRNEQFAVITTAAYSLFFSILSSKYWREMFPSGNRARSVRPAVGGKYRSICHTKISVNQTGIFGRMELAQCHNCAYM